MGAWSLKSLLVIKGKEEEEEEEEEERWESGWKQEWKRSRERRSERRGLFTYAAGGRLVGLVVCVLMRGRRGQGRGVEPRG